MHSKACRKQQKMTQEIMLYPGLSKSEGFKQKSRQRAMERCDCRKEGTFITKLTQNRGTSSPGVPTLYAEMKG